MAHRTTFILSVVFASTFWIQSVVSSGVFQLSIDRLVNERGLDTQGSCCSGEGNGRISCQKPCQTWFKVCLTHYQYPLRGNTKCTFESRETPVIGQNSFNPKDTEYFQKNPFEMKFQITWPGSFSLLIDAFHQDLSEQTPSPDMSGILTGRSEPVNILSLHHHGAVHASEDWSTEVYQHSDKQLHYSFRVKCDELYFGIGCSEYCRPKDNVFGHYTCNKDGKKVCMDGWHGDEDGLECKKPVCAHGCSDTHGYCDMPHECKCRGGWRGPNCTECDTFPGCKHGTCFKPYQCNCKDGWGGTFCTLDLNYCVNHKPCKNNAICNNVGQGSYQCECKPGFSGTNCEIDIDECAEEPCKNGAKCIDEINGYRCACTKDFFGIKCEKTDLTCADDPCKNGAKCEDTELQYVCKCPENFLGVNCEKVKNQCLSMPCANGGVCKTVGEEYSCDCPSGFTGQNCLEVDHCANDPCKNGGTCSNGQYDFKCNCLVGFHGSSCEQDIDECKNNPCVNSGTCHNLKGSYECFCPPGYAGQLCHTYSGSLSKNAQDALRAVGDDPNTNIFIVSDQSSSDLSNTQWIIICLGAGFIVVSLVIIGGIVAYLKCVRSIDTKYSAGRSSNRQSNMSLPVPSSNELAGVNIVRQKSQQNRAKPGKVVKKLPLVSAPYTVEMPTEESPMFPSSTTSVYSEAPVSAKPPKSTSSSSFLSRTPSQSMKLLDQADRRVRTTSECEDKLRSVHRQPSKKTAERQSGHDNNYLPSYEEACEERVGLLNPRNSKRLSHPCKANEKL